MLAVLFLVAGLALAMATSWNPSVPFALGGFFVAIALLERANAKRIEQRPADTVVGDTVAEVVERSGLEPGRFAGFVLNEIESFGTMMYWADVRVLISLKEDESLTERIAYAKELASKADELMATFDAFKRAEAGRHGSQADLIMQLQGYKWR